jgi:raffinose/stachyose/melibiose transport system permease protein
MSTQSSIPKRSKIFKGKSRFLAGHVVLIFFALTALAPLMLVLINSFKSHIEIVENPLILASSLNLDNFLMAWKWGEFASGFLNSIFLSGTAIIVIIFASSTMGYVLANNRIKIVPVLMIYFMVAMTIPIQLFMFTLYSAISKMNLLGVQPVVGILHAALYMPIAVFLMRTFFLKVPKELEEAARIDGANSIQVFREVIIPIVSPGMVTVAIIVGLQSWNEYLLTATFLQSQNRTATLGYLSMNGTFTQNMGAMMAGAVILIVPVLLFFVFVQRLFIDGLVAGAVKG